LWVSISPNSGFIGTAENALVPFDVMVTGFRAGITHNNNDKATFENQFNIMLYSMNPAQRQLAHGLDHMGYGARRIANTVQIMGGR
jgi:hypothetical protein